MDSKLRRHFDEQLEFVLADLPERVRQLMDSIPLIVDDYPSLELRRILGERYRDELCGLYTGVPLTEQTIDQAPYPSPVVHLFREGIVATALDEADTLTDEELRRQIRITILHEYGHHHGLDEDELEEMGY